MREPVCAAMRQNKRRRNRTNHEQNRTHYTVPFFFDRSEYHHLRLPTRQNLKKPETILLSADRFLSDAITGSLFHHLNIPVYPSLDEVLAYQTLSPVPRLIIDLDSLDIPTLEVLTAIRHQRLTTPQHQITLLSAQRKPAIARFIRCAVECQLVERRLPPDDLKKALSCSVSDWFERYGSPRFSVREWGILQALCRGESLKSIALFLQKPYHHVIYRLNVLLASLALDNRRELLHLLHEVSITNDTLRLSK